MSHTHTHTHTHNVLCYQSPTEQLHEGHEIMETCSSGPVWWRLFRSSLGGVCMTLPYHCRFNVSDDTTDVAAPWEGEVVCSAMDAGRGHVNTTDCVPIDLMDGTVHASSHVFFVVP